MEQEGRRYFRLGLFVAVSLSVLAAGLFLLGGRKLFQPTFTFETYFDKSVSGLELGAPVRFRGVPLGQVMEIVTSSAAYEKDVPLEKRKEYIVVRAKVNLSAQQTEQMERDAAQFVKRFGLSVGLGTTADRPLTEAELLAVRKALSAQLPD